jgi:hypothetical protein
MRKSGLVIALPLWILNIDVDSFVGVNFGLIRLSLACLSSSPPLTLEALFESISVFVLLLVKSLVAGGFYIVYAMFDSFTLCKFKFFITYCTLPLHAG